MTIKKINKKVVGAGVGIAAIIGVIFAYTGSYEPNGFSPQEISSSVEDVKKTGHITGLATTETLLKLSRVVLGEGRPFGYQSNDKLPPFVFLDNMPNWEFGVLVQIRDLSRVLRNDFARSQSQSVDDPDLMEAEPLYSFNNNSWFLPSTESVYRKANKHVERYRDRLIDEKEDDAQFYARADNLVPWIELAEKRLGSLSQRLTAAIGQARINTDLAGDKNAAQSTPSKAVISVKTPWLLIDDIFWEARGTVYGMSHILKAFLIDFEGVLKDKNALVSTRQIIRELEEAQSRLWSPMVLNGSKFGLFANHSIAISAYISRANAALIDLKELLVNG